LNPLAEDCAATLDRVRLRLGLALGIARAAWLLVAAAIAVEIGALAARGLGDAALAVGATLGALLVVAAFSVLVFLGRPSRASAARTLDAALGKGGLMETAAEALEGKHGAFAPLVLAEASGELGRAPLARLAPIEAPRGLALGGAAVLLLLALALGPAAQAPAEEPALPDIAIRPATESGPSSASEASKKKSSVVLTPTDAPGSAAKTTLPPEVARALEARLREVERSIAGKPGATKLEASAGDPGAEKKAADALTEAIARKDARAIQAAIDALAASGTEASREAVAKAADALARAGKPGGREGAGAGSERAGPTNPAGADGGVPATGAGGEDRGVGVEARLSWRVRETERRYKLALE
jgi:hypothetical protein